MTTHASVTQFEVKSHGEPDELRAPDKTRVEVVQLEGVTIGRFNFEPGWRWSTCIKPVVKTDQCQVSHVGYAVSGKAEQQNRQQAGSYRAPVGASLLAIIEGRGLREIA